MKKKITIGIVAVILVGFLSFASYKVYIAYQALKFANSIAAYLAITNPETGLTGFEVETIDVLKRLQAKSTATTTQK